jgi:hypothetical protein
MTDRTASGRTRSRAAIDIARVGHSAAFRSGTGRGLDFSFSRGATRQGETSQDNETKMSNRFFHLQLNRRSPTIGLGRARLEPTRICAASTLGLWQLAGQGLS